MTKAESGNERAHVEFVGQAWSSLEAWGWCVQTSPSSRGLRSDAVGRDFCTEVEFEPDAPEDLPNLGHTVVCVFWFACEPWRPEEMHCSQLPWVPRLQILPWVQPWWRSSCFLCLLQDHFRSLNEWSLGTGKGQLKWDGMCNYLGLLGWGSCLVPSFHWIGLNPFIHYLLAQQTLFRCSLCVMFHGLDHRPVFHFHAFVCLGKWFSLFLGGGRKGEQRSLQSHTGKTWVF